MVSLQFNLVDKLIFHMNLEEKVRNARRNLNPPPLLKRTKVQPLLTA